MTLFCKHNWHIHKTGEMTPYNKLIHGVYRRNDGDIDFADLPSFLILVMCSLGFGVSTGVISYALFPSIKAGCLIVGIILGFTYGISYMLMNDSAKWAEKDKTCLKCDKVVMDATNQENGVAAITENEAAEHKRLMPIRAAADERYKRYIALRAKS